MPCIFSSFSDIPLNLTISTIDLFVTKLNAWSISIGRSDFGILIEQKLVDSSDLAFLDKDSKKKLALKIHTSRTFAMHQIL